MTGSPDLPQASDAPPLAADAPARSGAHTPFCVVVDGESSVRHFVSLIMQGAGIDAVEFSDGRQFRAAKLRSVPDLIFLEVPLDVGDAVSSLDALGKLGFRGAVQIMSTRGSAVLEKIKAMGEEHKLTMLPGLKKPFDSGSVQRIIADLKLGTPPAQAARITLAEAISNNWLEFWFQPKIHLRKKQLAGAETFARARHPQFGMLSPEAFMPGADEPSLVKLSEIAFTAAIKTGMNFSRLGVNIPISVNISAGPLAKLPAAELMRRHAPDPGKWPGIIVDINEEQIIGDLALATELAAKFKEANVRLAIDEFGRGYSSLMKVDAIPFAEMKLDRTFVSGCSSDKVNAPICKTVINLAHNVGAVVVAIGVEKAADLISLVAMGCDYGQGFLLGHPMPEERFTALLRQRAASGKPPVAASQAPAAQPA